MNIITMLMRVFKKGSIVNEFIKYGLVGIIGTIIHTLVLIMCVELFVLPAVVATIIGFIFSLVVSYKLNSVWTFSNGSGRSMNFAKYAITCMIGLLINIAIMFVVVDVFDALYLFAQVIAIIVVPVFNFTLSRYWVFKDVQSNR